MTTISDLHKLAKMRGIPIDKISCPACKAMSIMIENQCFIAIDRECNAAEELVRTAHELGHCELRAFYNRYSAFDVRSKQEYKADKWAVQALIPYEELKKAAEKGYTEKWQLAELFGVTEEFIERAEHIYNAIYAKVKE